ncbi:MAG: hypothetical protein QXY15_10710 [Candidatus Nitrosotenuis sp.]
MSFSRLLDGNIHVDTIETNDFTYGSVVVSTKDEESGELKWSVLEPPYPDKTNYASSLQYEKTEGSIKILWGKMKIAVSYDTSLILPLKDVIGNAETTMFQWHDLVTPQGTAKRLGLYNDIPGGLPGNPATPNMYYGTNASGTLGWYSFESETDTSTHPLLEPPPDGLHEDTESNTPEKGALVVGSNESWTKLAASSNAGDILIADGSNISWGQYGTDEQNVVIFNATDKRYQLTNNDIDSAAQKMYFGTNDAGQLGWWPLPDPPPCGGGTGDPSGSARPCLIDHVMLSFKRAERGIYVTMRVFFSHPIKAIPDAPEDIYITIAYQEDNPNSELIITASVPKKSIIPGTSAFDFTFDDIPLNIEVLNNLYIGRIEPVGHLVNANTGEPVDISPPNCRPVKTYRLSVTKPPDWPEGAPVPPFPEEPPPPEPTGNCDPPPTVVITNIWVKDFFVFARAKASRLVKGQCEVVNGVMVDGNAVGNMLWMLFSNQQGSQEIIGVSKQALNNVLTPGRHRICVTTCPFQCWDNNNVLSHTTTACVDVIMGGGPNNNPPGPGDGVPEGPPQPKDNPGGGGGGGGKNDNPGAMPFVPQNCVPGGGGGGGGAPGGGSTVITLNRNKSFVVYKSAGIHQVVNVVPRNFQAVPDVPGHGGVLIAWARNAGDMCIVRGGKGITSRQVPTDELTKQLPVSIPASLRIVHRRSSIASSPGTTLIEANANNGVMANQLFGAGAIIKSGTSMSGPFIWPDHDTVAYEPIALLKIGAVTNRFYLFMPINDTFPNESGLLIGPIMHEWGSNRHIWQNDVVYPTVYEYNQTILTAVAASDIGVKIEDVWTKNADYNAEITFQYNRFWL